MAHFPWLHAALADRLARHSREGGNPWTLIRVVTSMDPRLRGDDGNVDLLSRGGWKGLVVDAGS
jgi:hypothetical protein